MTAGEFLEILDFQFAECSSTEVLTKKMMANICHNYLLKVLKEEDEKDWSAARSVKDLYECHSCVIHIAQCYVKGIVPLSGEQIFGANEQVTPKLADEVIRRLKDSTKRFEVPAVKLPAAGTVTLAEITELKNARVIDVRSEPSVIEGLEKTEHIPLKTIVQNPYILGPDLQQNIVLFCTKGYQSTLASDVLVKSGYENVFIVTG